MTLVKANHRPGLIDSSLHANLRVALPVDRPTGVQPGIAYMYLLLSNKEKEDDIL